MTRKLVEEARPSLSEARRIVSPSMGEADITFRRLLRHLPRPLLRLAFPHRRLEPLGPVDPSVDRSRQRTADNLFRVRDGTMEAAVHVEIEREWRSDIPTRVFEYACNAVNATRTPVCMRAELGPEGAPFCAAMRGTDEDFVRSLAEEVRTDRKLARRDRQTTMQLLYVVSAAILGSETARRIFHVESIIQDPNVQELIREWEDKGRAKGHAAGLAEGHAKEARRLLHKVLAARSFSVTARVRARIDGEPTSPASSRGSRPP